jgi:quercetin dioxygenase-like cupin family protein
MRIIHGRHREAPSEQRSSTFTGTVYADPVLPPTDGNAINTVLFLPGARTYWHEHESGQLLQVTAGSGLICTSGEQPCVLEVGDIVWVPAGERHWHGAGTTTYLAHLAVSLGTTRWLDEVGEADYLRAPQRNTHHSPTSNAAQ